MKSKKSSQGQKRRDLTPLILLLLLSPYIVGFRDRDSTSTFFSFGLSGGQYAGYHDCVFKPTPYAETNVRLEVVSNNFRYGGTATLLNTDNFNMVKPLFWPTINYRQEYFEIGTDRLRVGSEDILYAQFGLYNSVPAVSGRGDINLGIGFRLSESIPSVWLGTNGGVPNNSFSTRWLPGYFFTRGGSTLFGEMGYGAECTFQVSPTTQLITAGRYGRFTAYNIKEFSAGLGYRIQID